MIYTSGVINDITRKETLEELQDNKLALVCHKLELKPTDTLLDIGCGWGTLCAYSAKNFGCDVTGITLGKNQTIFGNKRIEDNGVPAGKARVLCKDYREIGTDKTYSKIVSLEMAEVSPSPCSQDELLTMRTARRYPQLLVVPHSSLQPPRGRRYLRLPGRWYPSHLAIRGPHLVSAIVLVSSLFID